VSHAHLLLEVGTEELPPKDLPRLAEAFMKQMVEGLKQAKLEPLDAVWFATPRRLTVSIEKILRQQPDQQLDRLGPALTAAFKDGAPTPAALGFAKSCGVELDQLEHRETDKGVRLAYQKSQAGKPTEQLILQLAQQVLSKLPVAKPMRWNDHEFSFVRPVQWIVAMLDDRVIEGHLFGLRTGQQSRGHRFLSEQTVHIEHANRYAERLREAHVLVDMKERQQIIEQKSRQLAQEIGGEAQIRPSLLAEAANLVEWPTPFVGSFDEAFLQVPAEALISSMESHQKCFSMVDSDGQLMPKFVGVANITSRDPAQMVAGFERVIRPRLADAQFFWNNDLRRPLDEHAEGLHKVVFQKQLGSLGDRVKRIERIASGLAAELGIDAEQAKRAARLAKCDLLTEMVFEFPDLQGIAGHRIAAAQNENEAVALALQEQYLPKGAGDQLPQSPIGQTLALADRMDTLAGIFAAGLKPTGSKDPFALRRAALGVIRILVEQGLDLDLNQWLADALHGVSSAIPSAAECHEELMAFVMDRTRAYYADQGIDQDVFDAVWAQRPTRLLDFHQRLLACRDFRALPDAPALAAANKRIGNILRKAITPAAEQVDPNLFDHAAENELAESLAEVRAAIMPMMETRDYRSALIKLAELRPSTDQFFDEVLVMAEHPAVRANRLALLSRVKAQFDQIADVSKLELETA